MLFRSFVDFFFLLFLDYRRFTISCAEMEGAAIAQGAYLNKIPYVVLRAISDKADDSATMDYPTFESEAARHCVNLLQEMVKRL